MKRVSSSTGCLLGLGRRDLWGIGEVGMTEIPDWGRGTVYMCVGRGGGEAAVCITTHSIEGNFVIFYERK